MLVVSRYGDLTINNIFYVVKYGIYRNMYCKIVLNDPQIYIVF